MDNPVRSRWHGSTEISSADLLRQCGEKLGDRRLWEMFQQRFQKLIFLYLLRSLHFHNKRGELAELIADLAQEVYVRLVRGNGVQLRDFRGETDFSVAAFLCRICVSVSADHLRVNEGAEKRFAQNVVSLQEVKENAAAWKSGNDELNVGAILSWIDIERVISSDPDPKYAQRNALIFKLFYIDGLTAKEISAFPTFNLNESGVQGVLLRLRKRIKK